MAITALNTALMASGVALVAHGVKKKDWDWLVIGAGVVFGLGGLAQATGHERASIFRTDWPPTYGSRESRAFASGYWH